MFAHTLPNCSINGMFGMGTDWQSEWEIKRFSPNEKWWMAACRCCCCYVFLSHERAVYCFLLFNARIFFFPLFALSPHTCVFNTHFQLSDKPNVRKTIDERDERRRRRHTNTCTSVTMPRENADENVTEQRNWFHSRLLLKIDKVYGNGCTLFHWIKIMFCVRAYPLRLSSAVCVSPKPRCAVFFPRIIVFQKIWARTGCVASCAALSFFFILSHHCSIVRPSHIFFS